MIASDEKSRERGGPVCLDERNSNMHLTFCHPRWKERNERAVPRVTASQTEDDVGEPNACGSFSCSAVSNNTFALLKVKVRKGFRSLIPLQNFFEKFQEENHLCTGALKTQKPIDSYEKWILNSSK